MNSYEITSRGGEIRGFYIARSPQEALLKMHKQAGYDLHLDDNGDIDWPDDETRLLCGGFGDWNIRKVDTVNFLEVPYDSLEDLGEMLLTKVVVIIDREAAKAGFSPYRIAVGEVNKVVSAYEADGGTVSDYNTLAGCIASYILLGDQK